MNVKRISMKMDIEMEWIFKENPKTHIEFENRCASNGWNGLVIGSKTTICENYTKFQAFNLIGLFYIDLLFVICELWMFVGVECTFCSMQMCSVHWPSNCIRFVVCHRSSVGNWMKWAMCIGYECDVMPNAFDAKRGTAMWWQIQLNPSRNIHKGEANGHR